MSLAIHMILMAFKLHIIELLRNLFFFFPSSFIDISIDVLGRIVI